MTLYLRVYPCITMLCAIALLPLAVRSDDNATKMINLKTRDLNLNEIIVPDGDSVTLLLFVRLDQEQTKTVIESTRKALEDLSDIRVLIILSGNAPDDLVKTFTDKLEWQVIRDPDFKLVGQLQVMVWPTNIVVQTDGREITRITGTPKSYVRDLSTYLRFATGKIDKKTLDKTLSDMSIETDSAQQKAYRHWRVAQRLQEKHLFKEAWSELDKALKLVPGKPDILLCKAELHLLMREAKTALGIIEGLKGEIVTTNQYKWVKGGALVAIKEWDKAIALLEEAVKINPNPSNAYYYLGISYQQKGDTARASKAFQKAFETTPSGSFATSSLKPKEKKKEQPATP